jgi:hypothetical protein
VNNWYAIDRLAAAHRADLAHEAAQARLAASAKRGEATVGDRKMSRVGRVARGALIALGLAFVVAAPAAAAQPTRTVIVAGPVTHYPAGTGCDFDVTVYRTPNSWTALTDFSGGSEMIINHAVQRRITNDATGAVFVESSILHEVDRFDGGLIRGEINGQFILQFYPGDVGLDGVVLDHLLALFMVGRATYVVDATTGATLEISFIGTATDICAAIS